MIIFLKDKCDHIRSKTKDTLKISSAPCLSPAFYFQRSLGFFMFQDEGGMGFFWLVGLIFWFWGFFHCWVFFWGVGRVFEVLTKAKNGGWKPTSFLVIATVLLYVCLLLCVSMEKNTQTSFQ